MHNASGRLRAGGELATRLPRGFLAFGSLMLLLAVLLSSTTAQARSHHRHHKAAHCAKRRGAHSGRRRPCHPRPYRVKHVTYAPHASASPGAGTQAPAGSVCADAGLVPAPDNLDRIAAATLCLVNQQRTAHGLGALTPDPALAAAAAAHAAEMVSANYFDHPSADGTPAIMRLAASGFVPLGVAYVVGENLGWGVGAPAEPAKVVDGWMHSPTHRVNILNGVFAKSGIGVLAAVPAVLDTSGQPSATYTQDFGKLLR